MMKRLSLVALISIAIFALSCSKKHFIEKESEEVLSIIYPEAYDIGRTDDFERKVFNIAYRVKLKYPSKEVVKFYDEKLKELGYITFIQPNYKSADRKWVNYVNESIKGSPMVFNLNSFWTNKEKTNMIFLGLTYYDYDVDLRTMFTKKEPDNNIQEVVLQVMPYFELPPKPEKGKM